MADNERDRDLVLAPNEQALMLDTTKGIVNCIVGSYKVSLSNSDKLVRFDEKTKRFVECSASEAITTFVTAPENWYVVLKNPTRDGSHPRTGSSNSLPELQIGKKVNIPGPVSFALHPGQMATVIQGHRLKSNQYLLAHVYDDSNLPEEYKDLSVGDQIIIKGTDLAFYMPETGIEVVPIEKDRYVRNAVSLERLQYCILVSENGEKRYVKGPAVVFPNVNEKFVTNTADNSYVFKAIELSDISGVYVKVVAPYVNNDVSHEPGEELFITGKNQMIYYPRAEHAIISYEGKVLHHAIAIPAGEGRYVLNRNTGEIRMVKGPAMYLPDPRFEVIVHRKLSEKECKLWYPGNREVLKNNEIMSSAVVDGFNKLSDTLNNFTITASNCAPMVATTACCTVNTNSLSNGFLGNDNAVVSSDDGFNRGNSYSKPRTITFDSKYDGVVSIDVWTGYAINVISKNGKRKTIVGPQTYLMEYDETLETVHGKDGDTVFLRVDNDRIDDVVRVQTKDFVDVDVAVTYCVSFSTPLQDKWFSIKDYVDYLMDHERSNIKKTVKEYCLEEFYNDGANIVKNAVITAVRSTSGTKKSDDATAVAKYFVNGMYVDSVEVLNINIANEEVRRMLDKHQSNIVSKSLELSAATKEMAVTAELEKLRAMKINMEYERAMHEIDVKSKTELERIAKQSEADRAREASELAEKEAKKNMQSVLDAIKKAKVAREKLETEATIAWQKERDKLEADRQKAYTDSIKKVIDSISPDLIAAMESSSHADMMKEVAQSLSPYALASGDESVSDVVNKLMRGTALEGVINLQVKDKE